MCGVERVADKHHVPERPTIIPQLGEISPIGFVGNQRMAIECCREECFAQRSRFNRTLFGKSRTQPSRPFALDYEGAHGRRVAIKWWALKAPNLLSTKVWVRVGKVLVVPYQTN